LVIQQKASSQAKMKVSTHRPRSVDTLHCQQNEDFQAKLMVSTHGRMVSTHCTYTRMDGFKTNLKGQHIEGKCRHIGHKCRHIGHTPEGEFQGKSSRCRHIHGRCRHMLRFLRSRSYDSHLKTSPKDSNDLQRLQIFTRRPLMSKRV
jgi:hypothetical protein